ncbi:hypothetical protein H6G93_35195 [Nostoc sp. FACHB-973]|nr:hypothetical protein [Nostoc sp. FACHB-973]
MKGDFSRQTFDPKQHYNQVLMQQGRVQLDADWNEQQAINQHRIETETQDVIGLCGAPKDASGFKISVTRDSQNLLISSGRYYVNGILCENDNDIIYDAQPDLPNVHIKIADLLKRAQAKLGLVYLHVWQRHITALDNPLLHEVALGGADTTTRIKTVWQVKILPIFFQSIDDLNLPEFLKNFKDKLQKYRDAQPKEQDNPILTLFLRNLQKLTDNPNIELPEVEKSFSSLMNLLINGRINISEELAKDIFLILDKIGIAKSSVNLNCNSQLPEWNELIAPSTGKLNARTQPVLNSNISCIIPPSAGYQRLENQLYRVEIHQEGTLDTATFKWSRDNGSVVTKILSISGTRITVADVGKDEILGFAPGQLVEIVDEWKELNREPGDLAKIIDIDAATNQIELTAVTQLSLLSPDELQKRLFKLHRWDSVNAVSIKPEPRQDWISLEGGIQVQFTPGSYKTGDYWLIPARTATGEIEWPYQDSQGNLIPQSSLGIKDHYCRLAIVRSENDSLVTAADCRKIFSPLTETKPAIHVNGTNWINDDYLSWETLKEKGLEIYLDQTPVDYTVNRFTMILTAEVTTGRSQTQTTDVNFIQYGQIKVQSNMIQWQVIDQLDNFLQELSRNQEQVLIRVTLKGHKIWSQVDSQQLFLDGQVFGKPGQRQDGKNCTVLSFPSGADAQASDFESWFWLVTPLDFELRINPSLVSYLSSSPRGTITLITPSSFKKEITFALSSDNKDVTIVQYVTLPPEQKSIDFNINVFLNYDAKVTITATSFEQKSKTASFDYQSPPK